jgi:hypothetical protein
MSAQSSDWSESLIMICKRTVSLLALLAGALIGPAQLAAQTTHLSGNGSVQYQIVHKLHKVVGISTSMSMRGTVDAEGLKAMARAQVGTFDSGNTNRDAHMMEVVEGEKYPWASVRVVLPGFKLAAQPGVTKINVQGAVELHGIALSHPIDLTLETKDGVHFHVSFEFSESLTAHKIERPSLIFVPVDDLITIVGKIDVTAKP